MVDKEYIELKKKYELVWKEREALANKLIKEWARIKELEQQLEDYRDFGVPECDHYWQTVSLSENVEELVCTKCMKKQIVNLKPECEHFWVEGMSDGVRTKFCVMCHTQEILVSKNE